MYKVRPSGFGSYLELEFDIVKLLATKLLQNKKRFLLFSKEQQPKAKTEGLMV